MEKTTENEKKECFEAFLNELLNWHNESVNNHENDLSKLKVLKLLFLGVSKNKEYLTIFNNFYAWELGPVEKDVYDFMNNSSLNIFNVTNEKLIITNLHPEFKEKYKTIAKDIIKSLKEENKDLITYSASRLVNITHKWNCWSLTRMFNINRISSDLIFIEKGYFS